MKKLQNLGKVLSKQEQKRIIGGDYGDPSGCTSCETSDDCPGKYISCNGSQVWASGTCDVKKTNCCRWVAAC